MYQQAQLPPQQQPPPHLQQRKSTPPNAVLQSPPTMTAVNTQANEKLQVYVYEYLKQNGAAGAAETFLREINVNAGAPVFAQISTAPPGQPGFLKSWWECVLPSPSIAPPMAASSGTCTARHPSDGCSTRARITPRCCTITAHR